MLNEYGHKLLLEAAAANFPKAYLRPIVGGQKLDRFYPVDPGYPRLDDRDPANLDRGPAVLTWRFTIPRGESWGNSPAEHAELVDEQHSIFWSRRLDRPLYPTHDQPAVQYINLMIRRV